MGDESRFRYRQLDEGQTRDNATSAARAVAQDPRRPETRGRYARDYARPDTGNSYAPAAPAAGYRDDAYAPSRGQAPAKNGGSQDSLAELAKLIGDEDPFADFSDLDRGQGAQEPAYDDDYDADEPAYEAPRAERFTAPVPTRGQSAPRASAYEAEPAARSARSSSTAAYGRQANEPRAYDEPARGYRQSDARYDEADDDASAYDAPRSDASYDNDRYASDGYDADTTYGADSYGAGTPSTRDDYAPAQRAPQLPARLTASREVAAPVAPRSTGTGAVRTGYGSLARQAVAAPAPKVDDAASRQDARGYGQRGYDATAYDDDGYESDAYDDRSPSAPGRDDRYSDRYDDRAYDDRGQARGKDTRGYAADGYSRDAYDDRSYADKGYADRGYDDRAYDDRGYEDGGRGDEAAYAYSNQRRDDDGYDAYDDAYDPEFADEGYMPPHGEEVYEAEPRRRKGRMALLMAASAIGLVVAGVAAFFAYRMAVGAPGLVSGGAPPVIRADSSPAKVVTPTPPATDSQQKLIYDRVGGAANPNEHVVPREEQPVDVATASTGTTGTAGATEPKRVRTLTVRADGSVIPGGADAGAAPAGASISAYAPSQNPIPTGLPNPTPVNTVPAGGTQTASTSTPPVSANGAYVVQVASQRSEADAMGSWRALQTRYPSLLGSYRASVKRAEVPDRGTFYRAQVGPFASRDQANELCQALRAQGGDCLVSKN